MGETRTGRIKSEYNMGGQVVILIETYTKCSKCRKLFPVQLRLVRGVYRNQPQCGPCRGRRMPATI
jgi:hypothetical protein